MTDLAALTAGLQKVRDGFVRSLPERESAVRALLHEIKATGMPGPNEEPAQQHLHRIAGTAATLGLPELGRAAGICEDELHLVRGGKAFDAERMDRMLCDVLHQMGQAHA